VDDFRKLHSTSGGSRETAEKELAVSPSSLPSAVRVVITVTPVTKRPKALRRWRSSIELPSRAAETCPCVGSCLSIRITRCLEQDRSWLSRPAWLAERAACSQRVDQSSAHASAVMSVQAKAFAPSRRHSG